MSLTIDIHALQTLPPSNINRDDTGAPKSAIFGGTIRQRVSSQAWKRAIRDDFETYLDRDQLGVRTKQVVDVVAQRIQAIDETGEWSLERAQEAAEGLFAAAKIKLTDVKAKASDNNETETTPGKQSGYLLFLSTRQINQAAQFLIEHDGEKLTAKQAKELLNTQNSVDIAMFGRMVADAADYNVDASVQVAHAIGVHESEPEFDFFTAVDDVVDDTGEESGAGMLGTVQMMSSTLYRFATIDFESLEENLGTRDAAIASSVAFVKSFIRSLPTGKLNTFANWTLPELVYVTVRDDRSISLVNAFEEPVVASEQSSRRAQAAQRLADEARSVISTYGLEPDAAWVLALGNLADAFSELAQPVTSESLITELKTALEGHAR